MGKKKEAAPASLSPVSNPDPGITVLWEAKVKRDIGLGGTHYLDDVLILEHGDERGFSRIDLGERCEAWEYRLKGEVPQIRGVAGNWLIVEVGCDVHAVSLASGQGGSVKKLKEGDFFKYVTGTHAIFIPDECGSVVMDLASKQVGRYEGEDADLGPIAGFGECFLGDDWNGTEEPVTYYIGRHESGSGRLLKENARPFPMPEEKSSMVCATCSAGFALTVLNGNGDCRILVYSWSGELLAKLSIEGRGIDGTMGRLGGFLCTADGSLDRLLFAVGKGEGSSIFLFDLRNQGRLLWTVEISGILERKLIVAGNRLFWIDCNHQTYEHTGRMLDLTTGESSVFIDEPVHAYLDTDGHGIFFGKTKQGRKHLAYGVFAAP